MAHRYTSSFWKLSMPLYRPTAPGVAAGGNAVAVAVAVNVNVNVNVNVETWGRARHQSAHRSTAAMVTIARKCAASFSNRMAMRRFRLIFWKKHSTRKRSL